jgi:NAD(P)H-dependent FMN reductase
MYGNDFKLLGLTDSIRRTSCNRGLIRAARELAPEGVTVEHYEGLAGIAFFNQDVEDEGDPILVKELSTTATLLGVVCRPTWS